jgi:hypothetical protein
MAMLKELTAMASSKGGKAKPDSKRSRKAHDKNRSGCKTCKYVASISRERFLTGIV